MACGFTYQTVIVPKAPPETPWSHLLEKRRGKWPNSLKDLSAWDKDPEALLEAHATLRYVPPSAYVALSTLFAFDTQSHYAALASFPVSATYKFFKNNVFILILGTLVFWLNMSVLGSWIPLEQTGVTVMSCHVGAGNWLLWKSSQCS